MSKLTQYGHSFQTKAIGILITDRDFLQLVDERVTVWSPIKKKFYTPEIVMKDYGVPAHNF